MENKSKALIVFFSIIAGTAGFYLAIVLQKQIEILIGAAIIVAFLSWLGSGTDFIGLVRLVQRETK